MKNAKYLITGGVGFIGYHLATELAKNPENTIVLVDNLARGAVDDDAQQLIELPNVSFVQGDLLSDDLYNKLDHDFDVIIHLAAIIGVQMVMEKPFEVLTDNVIALTKIIKFAQQQENLDLFIFTSTSEVYAGTLQYFDLPIPTPEDTALAVNDLEHPRTSYMLSKIYGEALCIQSGLPYLILRPHNIYGPRMGMAHVIPELLSKATNTQKGESLPVSSVDHKRTFCYVSDAVEIISRLIRQPAARRLVLNLGADVDEVSIGELANIVIQQANPDISIEAISDNHNSPSRRRPDMTKTTELTGYCAEVSLEEGVQNLFKWYKDRDFLSYK